MDQAALRLSQQSFDKKQIVVDEQPDQSLTFKIFPCRFAWTSSDHCFFFVISGREPIYDAEFSIRRTDERQAIEQIKKNLRASD